MRDNFDTALKAVLRFEGGYVNHPKDPGGPTNMGVTQRVYDAWRRKHGLPAQSVRKITLGEVGDIYRKQYWDAVRGDELPSKLDHLAFDAAVNSGPVRSIQWLQKAIGVTVDGHIGMITLDRAQKLTDAAGQVGLRMLELRLAFLKKLPIWRTFAGGWLDRIATLKKIC